MDQESLRQTISTAEQEMSAQYTTTELQNAIEVSGHLGGSAEVIVKEKKPKTLNRQSTPNPKALPETLNQQVIPKSKAVKNIK